MRRTLGSTVVTYAFALMATLGLPLILLAVVPLGSVILNNAAPGPAVESVLIYGVGLLVATNPIATAVATEVLLVSEQTAFTFTLPLTNGANVTLVSPWLPYIVFCAILGTLMTIAAVFAVRRAER